MLDAAAFYGSVFFPLPSRLLLLLLGGGGGGGGGDDGLICSRKERWLWTLAQCTYGHLSSVRPAGGAMALIRGHAWPGPACCWCGWAGGGCRGGGGRSAAAGGRSGRLLRESKPSDC